MKNNVIMFMIDSVLMDSINTGRCQVSPTPFMDSLRKEGLWTTNLYSHGPYTDAATRSLYTGRNVLDDFGYLFKLNTAPITHYKAFKDNGYETIGFYYPYYMMGNNVTKYIDKLYYKCGFNFDSEWGGVYSHFHEIKKIRDLTDEEEVMLTKRTDLLFEVWMNFYSDIVNKPSLCSNLDDVLEYADVENGATVLSKEFNKYQQNKVEYLNQLLADGKHSIFENLNDITIDNRISKEYLDGVYKKHKKFFNRLYINNIKANIFSTMPSPKRVFYAFNRYIKTKNKGEFDFFMNYFGGLFFMKQVKKRWGAKRWQNMPSTKHQLDYVENVILPNRSEDKPFFMCVNIEEAHNNLCFFTYDIQNDNVIDEEIKMLNDYLVTLGSNFKGNIVYYLGLRYMDWCLEKFCNYLKKEGLWNNTTILFTADHGSSYSFYPVHNARVNNFHDECYHIPVLIRHPGMSPTEITTYQYSKDILPTLMDIVGLKQSPFFKGVSMLKQTTPRSCVVQEYMGPGFPDILNKPIWFSARDENYLIAYKVCIKNKFSDGILCEVYDRKKDFKEYYNIVDSIDCNKIEYLLRQIESRFEEIKVESRNYFERLKHSDMIPVND